VELEAEAPDCRGADPQQVLTEQLERNALMQAGFLMDGTLVGFMLLLPATVGFIFSLVGMTLLYEHHTHHMGCDVVRRYRPGRDLRGHPVSMGLPQARTSPQPLHTQGVAKRP
jgi:hypothetical protein